MKKIFILLLLVISGNMVCHAEKIKSSNNDKICWSIPMSFTQIDILREDIEKILIGDNQEELRNLDDMQYKLALKAHDLGCYYKENSLFDKTLITRIEKLLISRERE